MHRPFEFASHADDDFSSGVSFFQIPDGLGYLGERVRPVDDRRERERADAERDRAEKLQAELNEERGRGFWRRLFGS